MASTKKPEEIAKDLKISVKDVQQLLGKNKPPQFQSTIRVKHFDTAFLWAVMVFIFVAPFVFIRGISDFANLTQMVFIQTGVAFFTLLWLAKPLISHKASIVRSRFYLPIIALLIWTTISFAHAHNRYEATLPWMHVIASSVMFFLIINSFLDEQYRSKLLAAIFFSGFFVALLGVIQHLFQITWIPQASPPSATFANKNMAVHFVVMTLPLSLGFILSTRVMIWAWLFSLASAVMVVFLIYTQTRAGWVALTIQIAFFAVFMAVRHIRKRSLSCWNRSKSLAAFAALVIAFVMINIGPEGLSWRLGSIAERASSITSQKAAPAEDQVKDGTALGSAKFRLVIWRHTIAMIKDHFWIGVGIGNHKVHYPPYHHRVTPNISYMAHSQLTHVHNDYLQFFSEMGIIGIILFGWLLFHTLKTIIHLHANPTSESALFRLIGTEIAILGLLVNAFFSFPFQRALPPFIFMILLGLVGACYADTGDSHYHLKSKRFLLIAAVVVCIVFVWLIGYHHSNLKADRYVYLAERLEKSKRWKEVIATGQKAVEYNPDRIKVLSNVGLAYIQTDEYQQAVKVLKKVVEAYPYFLNSLVNIGVAYYKSGNNDQAMEAYQRILLIKPDYAKVHYNIGLVAMRQKEYQKAASAFEKAVKLSPAWDSAHKNLGIVYFRFLGREQEGVKHFKEVLKLNPDISEGNEIRRLINKHETSSP